MFNLICPERKENNTYLLGLDGQRGNEEAADSVIALIGPDHACGLAYGVMD